MVYTFGIYNYYLIEFMAHRIVLYKNGTATDVINTMNKNDAIRYFKNLVFTRTVKKIFLIT